MDAINSYGYGYDQINVNPVRFNAYDDSNYNIMQNNQTDPKLRLMQNMYRESQNIENYYQNPPAMSQLGLQRHNERRQFKSGLEDVMRPNSINRYNDNITDSIYVILNIFA